MQSFHDVRKTVQVQVTLQLTVSQSVSHGTDHLVGHMTTLPSFIVEGLTIMVLVVIKHPL